MEPPRSPVGRRAFLGALALVPLAGCAKERTPAASPSAAAADGPAASPTAVAERRDHPRLAELERKFDARLGLFALDTGTGSTVVHRADERFAFCSTFKGLAAGVLAHNPSSHLDTVVRYTEADLMKHAPLTSRHVDTGMAIRQLCDAAVRFSDGTAGNLLLRDLGGPARLTAYVRGLGDRVTRMDRAEPAITGAVPGDPPRPQLPPGARRRLPGAPGRARTARAPTTACAPPRRTGRPPPRRAPHASARRRRCPVPPGRARSGTRRTRCGCGR